MSRFAVTNVKKTNEFEDWRTANNGGGYPQRDIRFKSSDGKAGCLQDTSCGDFGSRYQLNYDGHGAQWGSMTRMDGTNYSGFSESLYQDLLDFVRDELGFDIPSAEDFAKQSEEEEREMER